MRMNPNSIGKCVVSKKVYGQAFGEYFSRMQQPRPRAVARPVVKDEEESFAALLAGAAMFVAWFVVWVVLTAC